jgi:hypothetical protein
MLTWLQDNPVSDSDKVQLIQNNVQNGREAAEQIMAAWLFEKDTMDKADKVWYGPLPMLRLIMALVLPDKIWLHT